MKFRKTYIEITNTCDLSCAFCPGTHRPPAFMDQQLFSRILTQLHGKSSLLHFHVMGEPLLHPKIGTFLDLSADHGFRVNLVTNGRSLSGKTADLLGKPALKQVSISLQSLEHPISTQYVDNLESFINKVRLNPNLQISLRLWTFGHEGTESLHREILLRLERMFDLKPTLYEMLLTQESVSLCKNIHINCAHQFEWPDPSHEVVSETGTCLGLREQCAILADGTVVPCCLDRNGIINLGNIRESSLEDILKSNRAQNIISGFRTGVITEELCKKCTYRKRFDHES